MSINWRERFLRQQAESNVWSEINALQTQADEHLDEQRKEKINVGKNGAKTGYYRYNASTRNNYPACAKYNFVIVDTEGRKRCLTPLECSDLGFDYVTGTSQIRKLQSLLHRPTQIQYKLRRIYFAQLF